MSSLLEWLNYWLAKRNDPGTPEYWKGRYEDVLHEKVDSYLSGIVVGAGIGALIALVIVLVQG